MKKFLVRLSLFAVIQCCLLLPLMLFKIGGNSLKYIDNPVATVIDKHKRIDTLSSPKLIIVGGSNAFYGMNSERLEDSLHINVANMALFAGLGLDFMLKELEGHIKKNDVVLLSIEYFLIPECHSETELIKYYPASAAMLGKNENVLDKYLNVFKVNIESIQNMVLIPLKRSSTIYAHSRTANIYGDAVGYLKYKKPVLPGADTLSYHYYEGIERLNALKKRVEAAGASVYFTFPPLPKSDYVKNYDAIQHCYADFKRDLRVQMLCEPAAMTFDDALFFDTHYHLDREGRELRTDILIGMLKKVFTR